ncbi:MAG: LEA type 2 family protein [Haliea sp.]|nr:LEA type 2 family protein [Haliea sp.]
MIVNYSRSAALAVLAVVLLVGCASLTPELDPPKISVLSFKSLPGDGGAPQFEIKLRVLNPNKQTLDIAGISYSVALLERELVTGVTNDVSPIAGYGEGIVTLNAELQLLELVRLVTGLGSAGSKPLAYRFTAKIDFNGFIPTQRIEETGEIKLN